jgi:SAM-dependent methyltransferase
LVLAPTDELVDALLTDRRAALVCRTTDVCVLESADRSLVEGLLRGSSGWARVFEEYYLASTGDDRAHGVLVGAFFDWLADRYGDEIEPSRNLGCYEELYDIASNLRGSDGATSVLDVGCGPGTILRSRVARASRLLVGFDISEVAAKTAASEGMVVISREEFLGGPARFDVALSAYTMHYACHLTDTLAGVQRSLKSGGAWVLNFHKDIGLGAFLECLDSTALRLTTHQRASTYGSIVAVIKRCR